jgi:hypothetical protein
VAAANPVVSHLYFADPSAPGARADGQIVALPQAEALAAKAIAS